MTEQIQSSIKILAKLIATAIHDKLLTNETGKNLGSHSNDNRLPAAACVLGSTDNSNIMNKKAPTTIEALSVSP